MDKYFYAPTGEHELQYSPVNAIIGPRPIGWISSVSPSGQANLAPYSFFNVFNRKPPIIGFASIGRKDSVRNIEATGQFCWNMVSTSQLAAMDATSDPITGDEFEFAGIEKAPSRLIAVPQVAQSHAVFECLLTQIEQLKDASGKVTESVMVFGEVIGVHLDRSMIDDGLFITERAEPLLRSGGAETYFRITAESRIDYRR
ncbi:Flavin reductase like domain [Corynebacterium kutscheri]|uniref:Conserved protein of DIM6/NTAB family n=1 Tax=Corynebacterium kutscheri TaxID=35755 RepID=A0A0F6TCH8_9CORY|nr:flavin reductase family protein [Corynebacterium kutscheri]AKE40396.1 conserved protein of DIM6/NTAB family [Corynebacterium kutscheri]VEH05286.1 Flavin reductase like domain [Corynebacterium kutscheri]VEH10791.1 Flavin reductase like domain [Corynebacterium kutscheri]VEH80730.1 Flavin reductase like domain [Corynebacterium kutscheri]